MSTKPLVYLAGPYTQPDCVENTHDALKIGTWLVEDGLVTPFIPHVSLLWHMVTPRPYDFWLDYDIEVLAKCDALLRLPGESAGADKEVAFALDCGIPVFYSKTDLREWAKGQEERKLQWQPF